MVRGVSEKLALRALLVAYGTGRGAHLPKMVEIPELKKVSKKEI
jgi:hypothetical protein